MVEFWFVVLNVRERDHRQVLVALHRLHGARRKSQRRRVDVRRRVPVLAERRVAVAHVHDPHREARRRVAERQAAIRPVVEPLGDEHVVDRAVVRGVGGFRGPVVAIFLAGVVVEADERPVAAAEVVIDAAHDRVVVVRPQHVREVVRDRARPVRQRVQRGVVRGHRVDPARRNLVLIERRPDARGTRRRRRVVNQRREFREIAGAHLLGRHRERRRLRLDVPQVLVGHHEERPVPQHRTADLSREPVVGARRLGAARALGEQRRRRAARVAVEVAAGAADRIRAALEREVHGRAGGVPALRVERIRLHLELRDRVRRRREPDAARVREIRRAVDHELVAAEHAVGDDAAEVAVVHRPGEVEIRGVHDPGGETRQHVRRAVAERQLGDLLGVDEDAGDPAVRVEQRRLRAHGHRLLDGAGRQRDVDAHGLRHRDLLPFANEGLEAGERGRDVVLAGVEIEDRERPAFVGHRGLRDLRVDVDDLDRRAGNGGFGRIDDGAHDGAAEVLSQHRTRRRREHERHPYEPTNRDAHHLWSLTSLDSPLRKRMRYYHLEK